MRKVHSLAQVDQTKCIGDRICENVCTTGAIRVVNKKAVVDEQKCAACQKCIDYCEEGAIQLIPRTQPLVLKVDPSEVDQGQLEELCRKAHFHPDDVICPCTATKASEVGAAILKGAKTPEDISLMTGVRTACGMWCMGLIQEMLRAHGLKTTPPKGYNWYEVDTALWTIPDDVIRKYPEYRIDTGKTDDLTIAIDKLKRIGSRPRVKIAFGGHIQLEDVEVLKAMDVDILDIGRSIIDAPLLDMRREVMF